MLVVAVDVEPADVAELGVGPSLLDDLPLEGLVGELEDDVGVHGREGAGFMLDVCLFEGDFEHSENGLFSSGLDHLGVGTAATHS